MSVCKRYFELAQQCHKLARQAKTLSGKRDYRAMASDFERLASQKDAPERLMTQYEGARP